MGDLTAPPWLDNTNWSNVIIFLIICVVILLTFAAIVGFITYFAIKHRDLKKQLSTINQLLLQISQTMILL